MTESTDTNPLTRQPQVKSRLQGGEVDADSDDVIRDMSTSTKSSTQAFWDAANAPDPGPPHPFRHPDQRQRQLPAPLTLSVEREFGDVVQPWHSALDSDAVDRGADVLRQAVSEAESAAQAVRDLPADQVAERSSIAAAAAADKEVPKSSDWDAERVARQARYDSRREAAHVAARRFRSVVSSEARTRIPDLVEGVARSRDKARPKVTSAATEIRKAVASLRAVHDADAALGLQPTGWHRSPASALAADALDGLAAVERFLDSTDAYAATAEYVLDDSPEVPEHTAAYLRQSDRQIDDWVYQQLVAGGHLPADPTVPKSIEVDPGFADALRRKSLPRTSH